MKSYRARIIFMIVCLSAVLCSCGEEESVPKSSFGQIDAMQDGEVLLDSGTDGSGYTDGSDDDLSSEKPMKTARSLDIDDLSDDLKAMAAMCDAINMTTVELGKSYGEADNDYMWHCVHIFVSDNNDRKYGFERIGDYKEADPGLVSDILYAMFGKLREIPPITNEMQSVGEDGHEHVTISNGLKYRFVMGDRGTSAPEIRRVTEYSDSSLEMEVALVDEETGKETVSFIYTLRANTRDTSTSARFDYEITGARPADGITSDKLSGTPYLVPIMQVYGWEEFDSDDPRSATVEEILNFASFDENSPGISALNSAINDEILVFAQTPPEGEQWHEIMSYPLTTDDYVQVAITFASCPLTGKDPEIRCYGFDKKKRRPVEDSDLEAICGLRPEKVIDIVRSKALPDGKDATIDNVAYKGFIVRRDGSADIFCTMDVTGAEAETYSRLVAYNSGSGKIRSVFDGEVIPEDETDNLKPVLTHGRKDRQ